MAPANHTTPLLLGEKLSTVQQLLGIKERGILKGRLLRRLKAFLCAERKNGSWVFRFSPIPKAQWDEPGHKRSAIYSVERYSFNGIQRAAGSPTSQATHRKPVDFVEPSIGTTNPESFPRRSSRSSESLG